MDNRWSDQAARDCVRELAPRWGEALALRTYSSRLLGQDPRLVLHGGGNTSVKLERPDLSGRSVAVVCVKGSGLNLATIDPAGHVALELEPLRRLRTLTRLADAAMVNALRRQLLDTTAPNPSIEALLHAFLPAPYIDHTHADAILALTNRDQGAVAVAEALGGTVALLDYVHPGFELARAVADVVAGTPDLQGVVLGHHGLITWGDSARASYDRHIELVGRAEAWLRRKGASPAAAVDRDPAAVRSRFRELAPRLRGLLALPSGSPDRPRRRVILQHLVTLEILELLDRSGARELLVTPPPDHRSPDPHQESAPVVRGPGAVRGGSGCLWSGLSGLLVPPSAPGRGGGGRLR
ncbi:MAG: class II aldolase/adducin family protein [Magnetococcales bacterium]|nr:class II aldolase/adducin family protein [Magnetococcales bacterium]